ncbi:MAG: replication factor C large subunit [Acidilobaceae archaeon]|nr:replication factor C large subunit [Acidilobaceae archaeon]MDW7974329.1 replication factor C large subunit [Sulfolobales archaeon]
MRRLPWFIKHRPRTVEEVIDQEEAKREIRAWLEGWLKGKPPAARGLLLYGPPGVGKTSLVEAFARELDLELLELNASDRRRREDLERVVAIAATRRPLRKRLMIILMDEVDGIDPRTDEGGIEVLSRLLESALNPIIMTANDPWKDSLRSIRNKCKLVPFKELTEAQIAALLQRICEREGISCDEKALRLIASRNRGDARAAVNDLQALAENGKVSPEAVERLLDWREKSMNIWRTLGELFYAEEAWRAKRAVTQSEEDYETLLAWINDNIPKKYKDPEDLYRAYDALARATQMLRRAKATGEWGFLRYMFDLMGPGVALAKKGEVSKEKFSFPERIRAMTESKSMREQREELAALIAKRIKSSRARVKAEVLPYLFVIFREGSLEAAAGLSLGYSLSEEMITYLAGKRAEQVVSTAQKLRGGKGERRAERGKGLDGFLR